MEGDYCQSETFAKSSFFSSRKQVRRTVIDCLWCSCKSAHTNHVATRESHALEVM